MTATVTLLKSLGDYLDRPYNPKPSHTKQEQEAAAVAESDAMQKWFQGYHSQAYVTDLAPGKGVVRVGAYDINIFNLSAFGVSGKVDIASSKSYISQKNRTADPSTISNLVSDIPDLSYKKLNLAISKLPRFQ